MKKLSNQPYKGCNDYVDIEFSKLEYIFSKWREVALKYGFREYLTPVLELAEIYEAKSGEDIKKELFTLKDSAGRRLALRPEMTPSVSRLVSKIYASEPKPIKLFSIANFFRGERPQKGRDREFWQLNMDIFGSESIYSDLEILLSALDLMVNGFKAPKNSFILKLNNRKLINYFLDEVLKINSNEEKLNLVRKLDKFKKLDKKDFIKLLSDIGISKDNIEIIMIWMQSELDDLAKLYPDLKNNHGYNEIVFLLKTLEDLGYEEFVKYSSELIRGFDYYDGIIFEIFDQNPSFSRSLFGGGRYNGLAEIFGSQNIPAVGYAPGSPISIFLDNWNLWPNLSKNKTTYFLPILSKKNGNILKTLQLAQKLRNEGKIVDTGDNPVDLPKALSYANKRNFDFTIIYGEDEIIQNKYIIKNMTTGEQIIVDFDR